MLIAASPTSYLCASRLKHRFNAPHSKVPLKLIAFTMGQACCTGRRGACRAHCASDCIFCNIVNSNSKQGSRVIFEDDCVIALPDIRPAAVEHLLVIPKEHIPNVNSLTATDVKLVQHMLSVGQQLLQQQAMQQQQQEQQVQAPSHPNRQQQQQQQQQQRYKFGFHRPPFRSVDHLHLHCFTLPHKWYRWGQYQLGMNWVTADQLIEDLKRMPSSAPQQQQQQRGQQQQQRGQQQQVLVVGQSGAHDDDA